MNRLGEKLLSAFEPGVPSIGILWLDLPALTAHARDIAKENEHVSAELKYLVAQGMLRRGRQVCPDRRRPIGGSRTSSPDALHAEGLPSLRRTENTNRTADLAIRLTPAGSEY